jgi:hypothetical protein
MLLKKSKQIIFNKTNLFSIILIIGSWFYGLPSLIGSIFLIKFLINQKSKEREIFVFPIISFIIALFFSFLYIIAFISGGYF